MSFTQERSSTWRWGSNRDWGSIGRDSRRDERRQWRQRVLLQTPSVNYRREIWRRVSLSEEDS